jgi:hypothetical protein
MARPESINPQRLLNGCVRPFFFETNELKLGKSLATRYPLPATTHWQPHTGNLGVSHIAEN